MKRVLAFKWVLYLLATGIISLICFILGKNSVVAPVNKQGTIPKSLVTMTHGAPYRDVQSIIDVNNAISDLCREWVISCPASWIEAYVIPTGGNSYTVLYWAGAVDNVFPEDLEREIDRIIEEYQFK